MKRAELIGYSPDECAACRWNCWMLLGRFEEAWRESDGIVARGSPDPHSFWDGRSFTGNRVIIRGLHGFGDVIQFSRYARAMWSDAASVTLQTHPQLVSLFQEMPFLNRVITWTDKSGSDSSEWDQQIEIMELPRAFRTTLSTIPGDTPYISVDRRYVERARQAIGPATTTRVGLMWEGGDWNPARNVPLVDLLSVLEIPEVEFYSFQRGPGRRELAQLAIAKPIRDLSGDSPEVVSFAADLMNMDLLITVDTMAAHLAGALGKPVWVLLPYEADWRWMLDRSDSPWYPTMRLFRQRSRQDWRWPIQEVVRELEQFAGLGSTGRRPATRHSGAAPFPG
ncbi:MAG TPA: hypothetical protein VGH38_05175 [Bryobacteraceae bacterium]